MKHSDACGRKESLVAYLYDECEGAERLAFEAHLAACAECTHELEALRGVRITLDGWAPPEPAPGFRLVRREAERAALWQRIGLRPGWALAAAAVLVVAAAAAVANLELQYGPGGVVVRAGWVAREGSQPPAATVAQGTGVPWQVDLGALEQRLRREFDGRLVQVSRPLARPDAADREAELLRRVQVLVEESERRQRRELALRVAQMTRELEAQRQADLLRVQQGFGHVVGLTGAEVARQRELMNYLIRVSQRQ